MSQISKKKILFLPKLQGINIIQKKNQLINKTKNKPTTINKQEEVWTREVKEINVTNKNKKKTRNL